MKKNSIYGIFLSIILFSACSTDLDVVGDYKETLVVYGLLDETKDTQYVKVNKAFLGEGDAFTYAAIKDCTQFVNALDVKIKRLSDKKIFSLQPANWIAKKSGDFYGPDQTNVIYYFVSPSGTLSDNSEYELTVTNGQTGTVVTSKTPIVNDVASLDFTQTVFNFALPNNPNYSFKIKWTSTKNARVYQPFLRMHYIDSTSAGYKDTTFLDYSLPELKTNTMGGGEGMESVIVGKSYYSYLGTNLKDYSGLEKRILLRVEFILVSGADELNTYIVVNKPATGIVQEKPKYTNIENGYGIFSSRVIRAPFSKPLSTASLDSLVCGQYTKHLKFVNADGEHPCF